MDSRLVHATVVEDKACVCKSQARLLRLQVELHDLMVTCKIWIRIKPNQMTGGGGSFNSGREEAKTVVKNRICFFFL